MTAGLSTKSHTHPGAEMKITCCGHIMTWVLSELPSQYGTVRSIALNRFFKIFKSHHIDINLKFDLGHGSGGDHIDAGAADVFDNDYTDFNRSRDGQKVQTTGDFLHHCLGNGLSGLDRRSRLKTFPAGNSGRKHAARIDEFLPGVFRSNLARISLCLADGPALDLKLPLTAHRTADA